MTEKQIREEAMKMVMWTVGNTNNDVTRYISDAVANQVVRDELGKDRWIPVSVRLPRRYEAVLVTAKMEIEEEPLVYEGVLGTGWELCGVKNSKDYIVSAWMPLPEPYSPY